LTGGDSSRETPKRLPPVHFKITIEPQEPNNKKIDRFTGKYSKYTVLIEGGRLIQNLPLYFAEETQQVSCYEQAEYQWAYDADVINLLRELWPKQNMWHYVIMIMKSRLSLNCCHDWILPVLW
jgi:hypothetical protein